MTLDSRLRSRLAFRQTTLRAPFTVRGQGLHTGAPCAVTARPAPADSGITFLCRCEGEPVRVPALAASVVETRRCTALGAGGARLDTVEHLLSALAGLRVDNAEIEVDGPELPALDGSALPWVAAIRGAGVERLEELGRVRQLSQPVALRDGESWLVAVPADRYTLTCATHFDHPLLGTQAVSFSEDPDAYVREVAPARTFGFAHEVEALLAAGLARGGSLDNALVIHEDHFSSDLRIPDECTRHKLLDLIGDLSLAGGRLHAHITAVRPGHRANAAFAALLAESVD